MTAVKGEDNSVYVEADALNSYFQNLNDEQTEKVENLLGVTKEEVAEAAANGMEVTTTMGGLRGAATATNGALFEAVKDKVSFDVDGNSLNDLKTKQQTIKDYREAEKAENELNVELDKIRESAISAGASTSAANSMIEIHRLHAIAVNPENPAEFFKRNPIRYVKGQNGEVQEQAYNMVTNEKITADTLVPVVDVTGIDIPNVKTNKDKTSIFKNLIGTTFELSNGVGNGIVKSNREAKHFVNSSNKKGIHRLDTTRLKGLGVIEKLLQNAVYVDKHIDVKGTDTRYIDFYVPIQDGNDISLFLLVAKENKPNSEKFTIGEANFYDYIKKTPIQSVSSTGLSGLQGTNQTDASLKITIAEMLKNVKDRNGNNYVDANGNLNYEFGALKLLGNNQSYNQDADLYTPEAREQMEAVRKKYYGTDQWMKAPNGEPTKLTEEQWLLVRTPNFKGWFGDWENDKDNSSKVLDENGEPMVVYHGTENGNFNTFDKDYIRAENAFWFTDNKDVATEYAQSDIGVMADDGNVRAFYLQIKNPIIIDAKGAAYGDIQSEIENASNEVNNSDIYDGVIVKNVIDNRWTISKNKTPITTYGIKNSNQVKSATANNGNYSLTENNIYKQQDLGAISWDDAGRATISLFQNADQSTIIHESGHYFFRAMWNDIQRGVATQSQIDDFDKLLKYCDLTAEQWQGMNFEERRAAHERVAEAFETYFMEGKAPNPLLRKIFNRFKKWLNAIYNIAKGGRRRSDNYIPINDEVMGVFDRWFASEEEIAAMRRTEGYYDSFYIKKPIFI